MTTPIPQRSTVLRLLGVVLLTPALGCPDAVRGSPAGTAGADEGGLPPADAAGGQDSGPVPARLAPLSGPIAIASDRLFIATNQGIFSLPKTGGDPVPLVPKSVVKPIVPSPTWLFYSQDALTLDGVFHDGTHTTRFTTDVNAYTLSLDGARAFWVMSSDLVVSMDMGDGITPHGAAITVRPTADTRPFLLALTAQHVVLCLTNVSGEQHIVRRPKVGETANDEELATVSGVMVLATEGGQAYWVETKAGIRGADVDGNGAPAPITGDQALFDGNALAVDGTHVYWTSRSKGAVYRAARATGTVEPFASGFDFPDETINQAGFTFSGSKGRIGVDTDAVYVSDRLATFRIPKR